QRDDVGQQPARQREKGVARQGPRREIDFDGGPVLPGPFTSHADETEEKARQAEDNQQVHPADLARAVQQRGRLAPDSLQEWLAHGLARRFVCGLDTMLSPVLLYARLPPCRRKQRLLPRPFPFAAGKPCPSLRTTGHKKCADCCLGTPS